MLSRSLKSTATAALALSLLALVGCAGSKSAGSSGGDYSAMDNGEASKSAKLEDARRSAEDAEMKAHQLRQEKARNQAKSSSN